MKLLYLLSGLLVATSSVSCDKKDDPNDNKISVDKTELSFAQKGEREMFAISCIGEWHLEALDFGHYYGPNMGDVKDFTLEPAWGKGNTTVSVTLNNVIAESYTVDLKVMGGNDSIVVKLNAVANIIENQ
ncbi:hypothetical protein AGMMS49965_18310 [Bacteroidia bacterium]|nr:hypothetical protein AGMMS49965_18310 [Bacteroidia bacterium]